MGTSFHIFYTSYVEADPLGKGIFIALFLLSLISWVTLIYKGYSLYVVRKQMKKTITSLLRDEQALLHQNPPTSSLFPEPVSLLYRKGRDKMLELLKKKTFFEQGNQTNKTSPFLSKMDLEQVAATTENALIEGESTLESGLFILPTVVTLSPFLGLLGTVWGILLTFSELQKGGGIQSNALILGGLSTALTTTVLGLVIAIPALIGHNLLKNLLHQTMCDLEKFNHTFLSILEMQYRRVH